MIRKIENCGEKRISSSHGRGNDSGDIEQAVRKYTVYPTDVGMIRINRLLSCKPKSSSHRRGNDSSQETPFTASCRFIPQAWELFVKTRPKSVIRKVHPAGVGMIQINRKNFGLNMGLPTGVGMLCLTAVSKKQNSRSSHGRDHGWTKKRKEK